LLFKIPTRDRLARKTKQSATPIEVLHDHVTAAMLDGRNNKTFLHENEFNSSGESDSVVLPSNMAALT
jgi:hypothetical protein